VIVQNGARLNVRGRRAIFRIDQNHFSVGEIDETNNAVKITQSALTLVPRADLRVGDISGYAVRLKPHGE
jgi:hypothetical protein